MKINYRTTLRLIPCVALMLAQVALVHAADTADNRGQFSESDYKFAKKAACGGMLEVTTGNLAAANSKNPAIQSFGQQMVKDHGKAGDQLKQVAANKGATLPMELMPKQQKEVDHLSSLSGADFDKAYVMFMVKCHKMDEKEFKKASDDVQDADLKNFAATTLPVIQDHLKMVEDLEKTVKGESSSDNNK